MCFGRHREKKLFRFGDGKFKLKFEKEEQFRLELQAREQALWEE